MKLLIVGYGKMGRMVEALALAEGFTIVGRVDYQWMLDGHPTLLSHGWYPETGFIQHRWDDYSELMILYLLGLGASNSPLPEASWLAWRRPAVEYAGIKYVGRAG